MIARRLARPLLAAGFVVGGINGLRHSEKLAPVARKVTDKVIPAAQKKVPQIPSEPVTLVRVNAGVQIVAGLALATGRFPRASASLLAASLVPTTVAGHAFWEETDPVAKNNQRLQFAKNLSMLGGALLAAVDTEAQPSVAWRARRAAKDLRKEAGHMGKDAAYEARLAAAKVG
ncbi:hypothetical protein GCM10011519_13730 [Marmoricola endophyticus]|uniref:DoxX family protein n=2 Tax=Marmoricola endophyticus TaxID=2040280 RepID=A0A917BI94_9ACTN|nr:hypothetical protein GCM10011519_13730 [Marmoricola endophyticus]